jgi:hypothetical protein|tara:strand:+ start:260 stop:787 length:528 start_codon:yes stop_codon:yes gene_type:complete
MKFLKAQTTNIRGIQHGKGIYFDADEGVRMESTNSLNLPRGNNAQRPNTAQIGQIRYNTQENYVEFYQAGVWKPIRLQEPTTITQQSLGNGDGTETVFGPLNSGNTAFPVPSAAQNVIVLVENVFQLSTTNYTLEQSVSGNLTGPNQPYADGYYIKFTQAVPVGKPVTVIHNFDK